MKLITEFREHTFAESMLPFLQNLAIQKDVLCRRFRVIKSTPDIRVMFYAHREEVVLVGLEYHENDDVVLADEETFMENEAPFYFTESDHRPSPVYLLRKLAEAMQKTFREAVIPVKRVWTVLVTNSTIINKEEMEDEWLFLHTQVVDRADDLDDDFLFQNDTPSEPKLREAFQRANSCTVCEGTIMPPPEEQTTLEDEFRKMLENMNLHLTKQEEVSEEESISDERDDDVDLEDDFDLDLADDKPFQGPIIDDMNSKPFDKPNHRPYLPDMEDLRARAFPLMEEPEKELDQMLGCEGVRKQIARLTALTAYNRRLKELNPQAKQHKVSLHAIFQGAPGTGKTTLCKIYASLLHQAGVLSHGHVVVANRATFVGNLFGDEEKTVHKVLEVARGGVLMIDEAYQLVTNHQSDPGRLILPLMMPMLADEENRDIAVVLCGYQAPMQRLMDLNEGLASRFVNRFDFPEFTVPQLLEISKRRVATYDYHFTPQAWAHYTRLVTQAYERRDPKTWGNARFVANLLETIYINHAERCFAQIDTNTSRQLHTITLADVKSVVLPESTPQRKVVGFR